MISLASCVPASMMLTRRRAVTAVLMCVFVVTIELHQVDCSKSIAETVDNDNKSYVESLGDVNFLVGIAERAASVRNESDRVQVSKCVQDMKIFLDAVEAQEIWAVKLIDAFGTMPRSFVWGNNFWFSSSELCADIHNPFYISLSPAILRANGHNLMISSSPYKMHLQMVYFNYTAGLQLDLKQQYQPYIEIGLCVPVSCKQDTVTKWTADYFQNHKFRSQRLYEINMTVVDSKVPGFRLNIFASTGLILLSFVCMSLAILTILAEIVHVLQKNQLEISKNVSNPEKIPCENFLMCFSLRQNVARVFQISAPKDFVPVIAGLRTIVCLWVTLLHIYYHSMFTRNNVQLLYAKLESFILQPILQACFYVDVFFTISGFLLTYNFLSNVQHREKIKSNNLLQNVKLYMKYVFHRHFRLMPIFILTIVLSDLVYDFINLVSPFYVNGENDLYCKETWWYNLLYINNALPLSKMCSSWGWYIACEMQFYLFFLAILFIYVKSENTGKSIFILSAAAFISTSYYCYYSSGITFQIDVISTTVDYVYIKPWTRITPYFGGVFMGWLLYRGKDVTIKLKKPIVTMFWVVAVIIYLLTTYMSYWKETPVWIVSGIMSFGKLIFGFFIGSLISICQLGYGGIFAHIMGSKLFLYLNKFSFTMYMTAPIVISVLFGLRTEPTQFSELSSGSDIVMIMLVSHVCSVFATLMIELPFQRLSSRFILKRA